MELICPRFGRDRNAQSRGVAEGAVERVVDHLDFGNRADRRQPGLVAPVAIAESAIDRPDVTAHAAAVRVM